MTDWTPRDLKIKLDFLPEGTFMLKSWSDGPNAEKKGEDFAIKTENRYQNVHYFHAPCSWRRIRCTASKKIIRNMDL